MKYIFIPFFLLFIFSSKAQQLSILKTKNTNSISCVSIDRNGKFFIGDGKGNITQYDSLGTPLLSFSPTDLSTPEIIEAWRTMNIFIFYKELQRFILLDRFLTSNSTVTFNSTAVGFARVASISQDNMIWLFDDIDFTLKKYDPISEKNILQTPLDLLLNTQDYTILFIREYQNLVFIADKNEGVLVFDNLGNYKKKISIKNISYFNFLNDEIYFVQNNQIYFLNIYSLEERKITIPIKNSIIFVLSDTKRIIAFEKDKFYILQ